MYGFRCGFVDVSQQARLCAVTGYYTDQLYPLIYTEAVVDVIGETSVKDVDRGCRAVDVLVDVVTLDVVYFGCKIV